MLHGLCCAFEESIAVAALCIAIVKLCTALLGCYINLILKTATNPSMLMFVVPKLLEVSACVLYQKIKHYSIALLASYLLCLYSPDVFAWLSASFI